MQLFNFSFFSITGRDIDLDSSNNEWFALEMIILLFLEEVASNPTIEPPELTQDWETDSWRAQTKPCTHQDPGERRSDPARN